MTAVSSNRVTPAAARDPYRVEVGMGAMAIAEFPDYLMTPALGSCVGLALHDCVDRRGALAHVMLPIAPDPAYPGIESRFASVAVPALIRELGAQGSPKRRLVGKLAGGATMFADEMRLSPIGERNIAEVRNQLAIARVPLIAEDTGGTHARTVELHLDTGLLVVRSYLYGIKRL